MRSYFFCNLNVKIQCVKQDLFTADIYNYIINKFDYVKHDFHLAAFVFIQVCTEKTVINIIA